MFSRIVYRSLAERDAISSRSWRTAVQDEMPFDAGA
jgi:hypothetical protein